ncbi:MAG: DUF4476 domain-containing protein, partial [Planctomycetota bacterium]
ADPPAKKPASKERIQTLVQALEAAPFSEGKLAILSTFAGENTIDVSGAFKVLWVFAFAADRLKALEILADRLTDRKNAYQLLSAFPFEEDKKRAKEILD